MTVSNTALTGGDPDQPLRGVVSALSTGSNNTTDNAVATIGLSNSGIIGTLSQWPISPTEAATTYPLSVSQQFTLTTGGAGAGNSVNFDIVLSGGSISTGTVPSVGWAGSSTYFTSGSAVTTKPCKVGFSPSITQTYVGSTTNNCNNQIPNLATASQTPAGVQVTIQNYNVQIPGTATTGGSVVGCTSPTVTQCNVYNVSSVAIGSTSVSGVTPGSALTGTNFPTGLNAGVVLTIPPTATALASTDPANPDLINIGFTLSGSSYTVPGTCTSCNSNGKGCTFNPGKCTP